MNTPLYVLWPGVVPSKWDGDYHQITASQLRRLYAIPALAECVLGRDGQDYPADAIQCRPRYNGNYPTAAKTEVTS